MSGWSLLRIGLVILLVLLAGCSGGDPAPPSDERALTLLNQTQVALSDVDSYRYQLDGHIESDAAGDRHRVSITGAGGVNLTAKRMNATTRIDEETRTTYVTGQTAYVECAQPAVGWEKANRSDRTDWQNNTPLGRTIALLEETNVYYRGERSLAGHSAHVIEGYPTMRDFRDLNPTKQGTGGQLQGGEIQNITVRLWIDPETNRPLRTDHRIEVSVQGKTGVLQFSFRFSDYNASIVISVPTEVHEHTWKTGCPG